MALGAARQAAYERVGIDPARDGLSAGPVGRVYGSIETHHCMLKAAGVLGLGRTNVALLPVDGDDRVDVGALAAALDADAAAGMLPVAIVANAGTTNTGAVDPIAELAELAAERGVWLHVDGAYGLFGVLDPTTSALFDGVQRADSAVVDPHKWLAAPVGSGAAFVRDTGLLGRAFTQEPSDYLQGSLFDTAEDEAVGSPFDAHFEFLPDLTMELSAPSRGIMTWAVLHEIGAEGVRERVVRHNGFARLLADLVRSEPKLELLAEPQLSICCFRYTRPGLDASQLDRLNTDLARRLHAETPWYPSTTRVRGRYALRACFINPRTRADDIEAMVEAAVKIGDAL